MLYARSIASNLLFALYDAPLWNMALIASRLHLVWIATVCGKLETRYRYSNTLGWNTFPVPPLTESQKASLARCAEGILLTREAHFPAAIADLYDPESMPANLRAAHEANDETLERIYIGGGSFADARLTETGFWADRVAEPQWNLCNVPGVDDARVAKSKVKAVGVFLAGSDKVLLLLFGLYPPSP